MDTRRLQLLNDRTAVLAEMRQILDTADREKRSELSAEEQAKYDRLEAKAVVLSAQLDELKVDPRMAYGDQVFADEDEGTPLAASRSVEAWAQRHGRTSGLEPGELRDFSLGRAIQGMVTGRWHDAQVEHRVLSIGVDAQGGFLLPDPLAGRVIDRLRNATRVFQAGAQVVPMTVDELILPRLTGGATVGWKVENDPIVASDMTFDRITLKAKTLPILVRMSRELFDDLAPEAAAIIQAEVFAALALELDRVILRGSGTAPEPRGIRNQSGIVVQELGTGNGAVPTYDSFLDAIASVRANNGEPNAVIYASRTAKTLSKLKDANGAWLSVPPDLAPLARLVSNQVPTNLTLGTSTDCSEAYLGRWSEVLVGIRTNALSIQVLQERFADNLQIGLLAHLRADVALAHANNLVAITGIRPS